MNSLFRNVAANFLGQVWVSLIGLCFVPLYLKFIGAEGYGLIGFFVILSSAMAMFDGGFGAVATRQASIHEAASDAEKREIVLLLKSIEWVFWGVAAVVGLVVILSAPLISHYWLAVPLEDIESVTQSLRIMGFALLMQFPISFYSGALVGIQKQVALNFINSLSATVRAGGAVLVLWLISPSVECFFLWQCVISLVTSLFMRLTLAEGLAGWRDAGIFSISALRRLGSLAAGIGITNVLAFLLMQVDKIILSRILSLRDFGYYMLAWTVGTVAFRLISPVFNAYYPRITALVASRNKHEAFRVFIRGGQVLSLLVFPFSMWVVFYSNELLLLWTQDENVSLLAGDALKVLALGTMIHSLMHMPYALQLAYGWTRFSIWQNSIAVIFMIPVTYYVAEHYRLDGSAWPWLILNSGYLLVCLPIVFRKLNVSPIKVWCSEVLFFPFLIALAILAGLKALFLQLSFNNFISMSFSLGVGYFFVAFRMFSFDFKGRRIKWRNIP